MVDLPIGKNSATKATVMTIVAALMVFGFGLMQTAIASGDYIQAVFGLVMLVIGYLMYAFKYEKLSVPATGGESTTPG